MSEINKINYCLANGILPNELNYTSFYHSAEFFRQKYACLQNLPHSDGIFEEMSRNVQIEGITPAFEMEQRQSKAKEIENEKTGLADENEINSTLSDDLKK
jgi:hypothetical protein